MNAVTCPACGRADAQTWWPQDRSTNTCIRCETCGEFCITHVVQATLGSKGQADIEEARRKLARYLYSTRDDSGRLITSQRVPKTETYPKVLELSSLKTMYEDDGSPLDKYENTLLAIASRAGSFGHEFEVAADRWLVPTMNDQEATRILRDLQQEGYLELFEGRFSLTTKGLRYAAELGPRRKVEGTSVFVAACFDDDLAEARETIRDTLTQLGYEPRQVDREAHNNLIDLEIYRLIRESRFMVADLTCNRPSVYYEVGFAHGLGLEVVLTCREDHFGDYSEELKHVHFDLDHRNILKWETAVDLADTLRRHVYQSFGHAQPSQNRRDR